MAPIGDVFDWLGDRVDDVTGLVTDVLGKVPGASPLGKAMAKLVEGPLRDFARTPVGMAALRAISTMAYGSVAWLYLGPQLATIVWAMPGLLRGDNFRDAWLSEFAHRVEKTAEVLGGQMGADLVAQTGEVAQRLVEEYGASAYVNESFRALARRYGVSDAAAAFGLSAYNGTESPRYEMFDDYGNVLPLERFGLTSAEVFRKISDTVPTYTRSVATAGDFLRLASAGGTVKAPAPAPTLDRFVSPTVEQAAPSWQKKAGDVALVLTVGAGFGALAWFYLDDRKLR